MKPIGFIYLTTNLVNGKIYIGRSEFSENKRHNAIYLGSGHKFKIAFKKYGRKNFKRKILRLCFTEHELTVWEHVYIKKYHSQDKNIGYNIADGDVNTSEYNPMKNPEVYEKSKKANRRTTRNKEYRKKQSEIMIEYFKTHEGTFKGKHHTEESKKKMSEKHKGRPAHNKGIPASEEQKRKQSEAMKGKYVGEKSYAYGKHPSEETRKRMSEAAKKRMLNPENNPMYGSKWINNGVETRKLLKGEKMPDGWVYGNLQLCGKNNPMYGRKRHDS